MIKEVDVIIVGGGAAGFFTAINLVENNPVLESNVGIGSDPNPNTPFIIRSSLIRVQP